MGSTLDPALGFRVPGLGFQSWGSTLDPYRCTLGFWGPWLKILKGIEGPFLGAYEGEPFLKVHGTY